MLEKTLSIPPLESNPYFKSSAGLLIKKTDDGYTKVFKVTANILHLTAVGAICLCEMIFSLFSLTVLKPIHFFIPKNIENCFLDRQISSNIKKIAYANVCIIQAFARYGSFFMKEEKRTRLDQSIEKAILNFYNSSNMIEIFYRLHINGMAPKVEIKEPSIEKSWFSNVLNRSPRKTTSEIDKEIEKFEIIH